MILNTAMAYGVVRLSSGGFSLPLLMFSGVRSGIEDLRASYRCLNNISLLGVSDTKPTDCHFRLGCYSASRVGQGALA